MFISNEEKELTRKLLAKHEEMLEQITKDLQRMEARLYQEAPWGWRKDGKPCAKPGAKLGSKKAVKHV